MEWIIPGNLKYYDVVGAFKKFDRLHWKQSTNIEVGDIVYIYVGKPVSAIRYKCIARKVGLECAIIDDSDYVIDGEVYRNYGRYMEIELLDEYEEKELAYKKLKENGLKSVQGPGKISGELSAFIKRVAD